MNKNNLDAYLSNGNIILFCGMHSDSFKNDILHSTLYASLLATRAGKDQEAWWQTYTQTLNRFGWTLNSREVRHLDFRAARLSSIVIECTGNALSEKEEQALLSFFSDLGTLPANASAIEALIARLQANAYDSTCHIKDADSKDQLVSTAVLLTIVRSNKTLLTVQISFEAGEEITTDILNQPVLTTIKNGNSNIRLLRSSLDERQYSQFREPLINKLGNKLQTDLFHFNASPSAN